MGLLCEPAMQNVECCKSTSYYYNYYADTKCLFLCECLCDLMGEFQHVGLKESNSFSGQQWWWRVQG